MPLPEKPLNVYILTHEFYPAKGGIATFVEELARATTAIGRQVEVWAPRCETHDDEHFPFTVKRLQLHGTHDLSCQISVAKAMWNHKSRLNEGIVHLCEPGPILAMCYLQFLQNFNPRRLILTFHGSEIARFASNPLRHRLVTRLIARSTRTCVLSDYSRQLLENAFPIARAKTIVAPGALKADFSAPTTQTDAAREKIDILTVGRLHPRKGQARLLEALKLLPPELTCKIQLTIVGTGNKGGYGDKLRSSAASAAFPVKFLGDISDQELGKAYSQADIFALTSLPYKKSVEGFGLVYLEAAAYGLPIVAHRIGGVASAVDDQVNGILVAPESLDQLVSALCRLITDNTLRQSMGARGRERAQRDTWTDSAHAHFDQLGT